MKTCAWARWSPVIATFVYNAQVSTAQLQTLSSNLNELSTVLAGGREMKDLVGRVVETIARVLHAQASSLYLIDEAKNELVIQAATGYQTSLLKAGATYTLGEGITGWIAQNGKAVRANSLDDLRSPAWGKQR
jgi:signal transduction protein with GAF and PtsI domain